MINEFFIIIGSLERILNL